MGEQTSLDLSFASNVLLSTSTSPRFFSSVSTNFWYLWESSLLHRVKVHKYICTDCMYVCMHVCTYMAVYIIHMPLSRCTNVRTCTKICTHHILCQYITHAYVRCMYIQTFRKTLTRTHSDTHTHTHTHTHTYSFLMYSLAHSLMEVLLSLLLSVLSLTARTFSCWSLCVFCTIRDCCPSNQSVSSF